MHSNDYVAANSDVHMHVHMLDQRMIRRDNRNNCENSNFEFDYSVFSVQAPGRCRPAETSKKYH